MNQQKTGDLAIGVEGLPVGVRQMLPGGLYAVTVDHATAHDGLVVDTLRHALRTDTVVLVTASPAAEFLAQASRLGLDCEAAIQQGKFKLFSQLGGYAEKISSAGMTRFMGELEYFSIPHASCIIIDPADELVFRRNTVAARKEMDEFWHWLKQRGSCALLVLTSPVADSATQKKLQSMEGCFTGLAGMTETAGNLLWKIDYWHAADGTVAAQEYDVGLNSYGSIFSLSGEEIRAGGDLQKVLAADEGHVIATTSAIGHEKGVPADWKITSGYDELLAAANGAISATILLHFEKFREFGALAHAVYKLRHSCGRRLKIAIRERGEHLRYSQELLLLRLGANTVIYSEVPFSRILRTLDSIQSQTFGRDIESDFDSAVSAAMPTPVSGYLAPDAFCQAVLEALERARPIGLTNALVRLPLLLETPHLDALRACKLKRPGDIFTADDRSVYLFLFACQESDIDVTLERMFSVPLAELFEGQLRFPSAELIQQETEDFQARLDNLSVTDFSALLPITAPSSPLKAEGDNMETPAAPESVARALDSSIPEQTLNIAANNPVPGSEVAPTVKRSVSRKPLRLKHATASGAAS